MRNVNVAFTLLNATTGMVLVTLKVEYLQINQHIAFHVINETIERLGYPVSDIETGLAYHPLCRSRSRCWNIVSKVGLCRRDKYLSIDV